MSACVENGQRLHQDAEWLGSDRSATVVALCILAQEEFAKAFLLHLVCEGIIPWTAKVRESLRNHKYKQLVGLIMEWLSPSDDEFSARITTGPREATLPAHVADAMKLYVEKVLPQGHISCPPAASDPMARSVAGGDRDKTKQDALYVRLSEDGDVISVPSQVTIEMVEAELDRTKRLSDLVRPLREGTLGPVLDYHLLVETMSFLLLDKRNRPFLILKESEFGGPVTSPTGTTWLHSITVLIENISEEQATRVSGHATVFLDKEVVRPFFSFDQFAVDPHATNRCTFFVSEETYACGTSPSHQLDLSINLEYHGILSDRKYHARMWSTYDPSAGTFGETFTDSQESVIGGSQSLGESETRWRRPTTG
jgi:AbiV family abortive infection protein